MSLKRTLLSIFFLIPFAVYSQGKGDIPPQLKADNSHFIVFLVNYMGTSSSEVPFFDPAAPDASASGNEEHDVFPALAAAINKDLQELGIRPAGFIQTSMSGWQNPDQLIQASKRYVKEDPAFYMVFSFMSWEQEKAALKKGRFDIAEVKCMSMGISEKLYETNPDKIFGISDQNMSLSDVMETLAEKIAEKPAGYFVESIERSGDQFSDKNGEPAKKALATGDTLATFPEESELKTRDLLVVVPLIYQNSFIPRAEKLMDERYPYGYKVITQDNYAQHVEDGSYAYALLPEGSNKEVTTRTTRYNEPRNPHQRNMQNGTNLKTTERTRTAPEFYYTLKGFESLNAYYGPNKDRLIKQVDANPVNALKRMLKEMEDHYGWE